MKDQLDSRKFSRLKRCWTVSCGFVLFWAHKGFLFNSASTSRWKHKVRKRVIIRLIEKRVCIRAHSTFFYKAPKRVWIRIHAHSKFFYQALKCACIRVHSTFFTKARKRVCIRTQHVFYKAPKRACISTHCKLLNKALFALVSALYRSFFSVLWKWKVGLVHLKDIAPLGKKVCLLSRFKHNGIHCNEKRKRIKQPVAVVFRLRFPTRLDYFVFLKLLFAYVDLLCLPM